MIKKLLRRYFIDAMGAMVLGLFSSLVIGLILKQIFTLLGVENHELCQLVINATSPVSPLVGAAMGAAVAYGLKSHPLALYSAVVVGAIGYGIKVGGISAGPVGAFVSACVAAEIGSLVAGRTRMDILVVPGISITAGALVAMLVGPPVAAFMVGAGELINHMTQLHPLPMGIAVAAIMGLALSGPISSAALAIMLGLSGLAGGAATAGCCAHMVGFAVASYRENGMAGLISQGLGTSKLQLPNIMRAPQILLPALIASMITGPLATMVFGMENIPAGSGMGSSGFVGLLTTYIAMPDMPTWQLTLYMLVLYIAAPALIAWQVSALMRKKGWIKPGQMKLTL